jgi:hypothetical protein
MKKYAGASLVVLGIVMTAYGLDLSHWQKPQIPGPLLMRPLNESACLLIGGMVSLLIGFALLAIRRQRAS